MKKYIFIVLTVILIIVSSCSSDVKDNTEKYEVNAISGITPVRMSLAELEVKDEVTIRCEEVKAMDFTTRKPHLKISPEVDLLYKEAYLKILKNEIPTIGYNGKIEYFRDLYAAGAEFEDLNDRYEFYYTDLDGDGWPELGIGYGYVYILKYEPEINQFRVILSEQKMYTEILGMGQIWHHDGLHASVVRDLYVIFNKNSNEWETVLELQMVTWENTEYYYVGTDEYNSIDVGEENWNEITKPFFELTKNVMPSMTLEEVFGDLLEK